MSVTPSKVLHVRNLAPNTEANDLRQYVASFGQVSYVVMLPKYQQALVEMGDESQATTVIQYSQMQPVNIKGRDVVFTFSKSTEIKRSGPAPDSQPQEHNGEHVLLITILNPLYAIDVNVLHSILGPYGNVLRIVIFHKNGTQALAEFDDPQSAMIARQNLDGKDIYDGCCTLRISYSRTDKLNVRCNNDKTRDFTNPNLPTHPVPEPAAYGMVPQPGFQPMFQSNVYQPMPVGVMSMASVPIQQDAHVTGGPGSVLMVYNLPVDVTCDHVFNLFCLYGNVVRVKLLAGKEGTAMVQMGDKTQADQALNLLNTASVEGNELSITFSKHPFIAEPRAVAPEANGDGEGENPICKDYAQSPMNRFTRQPLMAYKHIYRPTQVLYFSNCAPNTTEQTLLALLDSCNAPHPTGTKFFASTQTPKKTGLMEFEAPDKATAAVLRANNTLVDGYTVKLAFSVNSFSGNKSQ